MNQTQNDAFNDSIIQGGFGETAADSSIVIDVSAEPVTSPALPVNRKAKLRRAATIAGAGIVLLSIAGGVLLLQHPPAPKDPALEAVLTKPVTPTPPPPAPEPAAPAAPPENPQGTAAGGAGRESAPVAPPAAELPVAKPAETAPMPITAVSQAPQPPKVAEQTLPTQGDQDVAKRIASLDASFLRTVEVIDRIASRLNSLDSGQADLKKELERLTKANAELERKVKDLSRPEAKPAPIERTQKPAEKPAATPVSKPEKTATRIEKPIAMKEFNILAMTTESVIFGPAGKEQEVFVGSMMPGLNGTLEKVDPMNRRIVTSTRIYTVTQ